MMRRLLLVFLLGAAATPVHADWQQELTPATPGGFPLPRPLTATYRCGWSGLSAAEVNVSYSRPKGDIIQLDGKGGTTGFARTLWRLDATHTARANATTLRPISMRQIENYRAETIHTELTFDDDGVTRFRESKPADKNPPKKKRFDFPNLYDMHAALLFLRSQKLQPGQTLNVPVYAAATPYLVTVRVIGREKIKVRAGTYPAVKLDLKLQKISRDLQLEPHTKFRRATVWMSDDADRLLLKVQAEIFVGNVWAELDRVQFAAR